MRRTLMYINDISTSVVIEFLIDVKFGILVLLKEGQKFQ